MAEKKKKGTLWNKMQNIKSITGSQAGYKQYLINGGTRSFTEWKQENK